MAIDASVAISFFNNWGHYSAFPEVSLFMEGTEMCVATEVTNKYARQEVSVNRIQKILDGLLGPFVWENEIDHALRLTQIYGSREMARLEAMLDSVPREGEREKS